MRQQDASNQACLTIFTRNTQIGFIGAVRVIVDRQNKMLLKFI
ncbi:hypothetical protein M2263_000004 [Providencia alcalifaciens]|nr:hypothetical protein [Providencia alcalifaciens]